MSRKEKDENHLIPLPCRVSSFRRILWRLLRLKKTKNRRNELLPAYALPSIAISVIKPWLQWHCWSYGLDQRTVADGSQVFCPCLSCCGNIICFSFFKSLPVMFARRQQVTKFDQLELNFIFLFLFSFPFANDYFFSFFLRINAGWIFN